MLHAGTGRSRRWLAGFTSSVPLFEQRLQFRERLAILATAGCALEVNERVERHRQASKSLQFDGVRRRAQGVVVAAACHVTQQVDVAENGKPSGAPRGYGRNGSSAATSRATGLCSGNGADRPVSQHPPRRGPAESSTIWSNLDDRDGPYVALSTSVAAGRAALSTRASATWTPILPVLSRSVPRNTLVAYFTTRTFAPLTVVNAATPVERPETRPSGLT